MSPRLYLLHALSPLHAGVGQGQGVIDLPIARDPVTKHPLVPGSSLKGALRARSDAQDPPRRRETEHLFGPRGPDADRFPSAVRLSDANLLLFPVCSDAGTFAWATSLFTLRRAQRAGMRLQLPEHPPPQERALVVKGSPLRVGEEVVLGDQHLKADPLAKNLGKHIGQALFPEDNWWADALAGRLVILPDDSFNALTQRHTEVRARVRQDPETGVVAKGALWYEESLPAETVLWGMAHVVANTKVAPERGWDQLQALTQAPLQLGGKHTVGLGHAQLRWMGSAT